MAHKPNSAREKMPYVGAVIPAKVKQWLKNNQAITGFSVSAQIRNLIIKAFEQDRGIDR